MRKINISENQFNKNFHPVNRELGKIRNDVADYKLYCLKDFARNAVHQAFEHGANFEKTSPLNFSRMKRILIRLDQLYDDIDSFL